jgi:DNA-binding CsgD family transcriptional regulator
VRSVRLWAGELRPVRSVAEHAPAVDALPALAGWINLERRARLIVTPAGDVLWISTAARALIDASSPLHIQGSCLTGKTPQISDRLRALLVSVGPAAPCWMLEEIDAVIWAQQIETAGPVRIGLTIRPMGEELQVSALAEARELTAAEARVVGMMLGGAETGRIAQALDISVETLRTHVKHVYRKLGVKSRGELFATALQFAQP